MAELINRYKLENNGEDLIGENDGTVTGSFSSVSPKEGSYSLGLNSKLSIPATPINLLMGSDTAKFSFSFWVKTSAADDDSWVITNNGGYDNGFNIHIDSLGYGKVKIRNNDEDNYNYWYFNGLSLIANQWNHVVFTYDHSLPLASRVSLFTNKVERSTFSTSLSLIENIKSLDELQIGNLLHSYFLIDDFRIYSGVLSEAEIENIYNNDIPVILGVDQYNSISASQTLTITGLSLSGETVELKIDNTDYSDSIITNSQTQIEFSAPNLSYGIHYLTITVDEVESNSYSIFYSEDLVFENPASGDMKLFQTGPEWADIQRNPSNLSQVIIDDGLENNVLILLFTDKRADDSDILPNGCVDKQGFWGDTLLGSSIGSKLWLLQRERMGNKLIVQAQQYCEESLQPLIDDKIIDSVTVEVKRNETNKNELVFNISIIKLNKGSVGYSYFYNWQNQTARKVI